jgi:tetratricopeptide (TPR) repeat protein
MTRQTEYEPESAGFSPAYTRRDVLRLAGAATASGLAAALLVSLTVWNVTRSDALGEAQRAYTQRDVVGCLRLARDHLARRPWSRAAALLAARCLSHLDYPDEAEPYYHRAGRLSLDDLQVRAYGIARSNQHTRAIRAYQEIVARWPGNLLALRRLAAVELAVQNRTESLALADRLIAIPGGEAVGFTLRGTVHHDDENRAEAVAAYERVLQLDPELRVMPLPRRLFWSELGDDLVALGRIADARRHLRRAVAQKPDAALMTMLGRAAQLEGDIDDAEACFRQAAAWDPQYAFPHIHLGQLAIERRQFEEASAELRQALRLSPRNFQAAYNLSLALRQLGRLDEATRCQRLAERMGRSGEAHAWHRLVVRDNSGDPLSVAALERPK